MNQPGYIRGFVVVSDADVAAARAIAKASFDPIGGTNSFACGLVPSGSPEGTLPTHWMLSANFTAANWSLLPSFVPQVPSAVFQSYDLQTDPNAPWTYCESINLQRPNSTII